MYEIIKTIKLYVDRMDAETAKRAGISYPKFKALVSDNIWVETPEALSMGLADGVVYLNVTHTFSQQKPKDVLTMLKKSGKFTPQLMNVKGYTFNFNR
jgi:hypothetical protein